MYKYVLIAALAAGIVYLGSWLEKRLGGKGSSTGVFAAPRIVMIASYVLAALVFCVLAGLRGTTVGTDVQMYVVPAFEAAQEVDFVSFFTVGEFAGWMPLSKIAFWAVPALTHSLFCLLFAIHAIIVIPLFVALRLVLKERAWLAVLIFGIAFFPISLNIMRQFMGMGFIMLSYLYMRKRKPALFLLYIVIAFLFHETCLIGLLVYPIWLTTSGNLKRIKINPAVMGIASFATIRVFFPLVGVIAPLISGKFHSYTIGGMAEAQGSGGTNELRFIILICVVLGLLYCWFTRKKKAKQEIDGETSGLAAIVFFGVAVFSMCLYSFQLFRLGVFFLYFALFLVPIACERIVQRRDRLEFAAVAICILAIFAQSYYGTGAHAAVPYFFELTGKF